MKHLTKLDGWCPVCEWTCSSVELLQDHLESKHSKTELVTAIIDILFPDEDIQDNDALEKVQEAETASSLDFQQDSSSRDEPTVEAEEKSQKTRSEGKRIHECNVCHKNFASRGNLNKHKILHQTEKPWKCEHCEQSFNQKRDYNSHVMQWHSGDRPHVCRYCGKGFVHKFYLTEHLDYHSGNRKFQCYKCGKKFASSSTLAKHTARHKKERSFHCHLCPKSFVVSWDLRSHVKFVHEKVDAGGIPVFPPSGAIPTKVPENYEPVLDEEESSADPLKYHKPKPALRMIRTTGSSTAATEAATTTILSTSSSISYPPVLSIPDEPVGQTDNDTESQRQIIEDWMISQGFSVGPSSSASMKIPNFDFKSANS